MFLLFWQAVHLALHQRKFNYAYWLSALFSVQLFMFNADHDLRRSGGTLGVWYPSVAPGWETLFRSRGAHLVCNDYDGHWHVVEVIKVPKLPILLLHWFGSFACNGVWMQMICFIMPLLLAHSRDPMEFVLNSFAMSFLIRLDDADAVTFTVIPNEEAPPPPPTQVSPGALLEIRADDSCWLLLETRDSDCSFDKVSGQRTPMQRE